MRDSESAAADRFQPNTHTLLLLPKSTVIPSEYVCPFLTLSKEIFFMEMAYSFPCKEERDLERALHLMDSRNLRTGTVAKFDLNNLQGRYPSPEQGPAWDAGFL